MIGEQFYAQGQEDIAVLSATAGVLTDGYLQARLTNPVNFDALAGKIHETYENLEQVISPDGHYAFEITTLNKDAPEGAVVFAATFRSSLGSDRGNAKEIADKALRDQRHSYVYLTLPGNGSSGPLTQKERKHIAGTGGFYDLVEGRALPVVYALRDVLAHRGVAIEHLASDSTGALFATALGIVSPKDTIKTVFQNARTGWRHMSPVVLAKGMLHDEPVFRSIHRTYSPDVLGISEPLLSFVKESTPQPYKDRQLQPNRSLPTLWAYLYGLARGPEGGNDPLVNGMQALVARQPSTDVLFVSSEHDVLVRSPTINERLRTVLGAVSLAGGSSVRSVMIAGGSHTTHTYYPQYVDAIRMTGFGNDNSLVPAQSSYSSGAS